MGRRRGVIKSCNRQSRSRKKGCNADLMIGESPERSYGKGADKRYIARIRPQNESQAEYIAAIEMGDIIFGLGSAGTGKTYIAVCLAVDMLNSGRVTKIILSRPAVEAEGEHFGFLPGSLEDKIAPYLLPIYDVLNERLGAANLRRMIADGRVELCPLAFMRGRTFTNAVMILDEMQNATKGQIKMALTRMGEGTKAIVTGDPEQSDLPEGESGLMPSAEKLENAPGIEVVRFAKENVVRSTVVRTVLEHL